MNLLQFLLFYQIIRERENGVGGKGGREGRSRWLGRERKNSVTIFPKGSFSGLRISMSGSKTKAL